VVDLSDETTERSGRNIYLLAVVGATCGVNVKSSQDLADGLVNSENDLVDSISKFRFRRHRKSSS
jgi:hypothetical protein